MTPNKATLDLIDNLTKKIKPLIEVPFPMISGLGLVHAKQGYNNGDGEGSSNNVSSM